MADRNNKANDNKQNDHNGRTYLCIDLKSFYASVECIKRGLDPFTTNLIVADPDRTKKTICLAITPAMKKLGIKSRCRVFEIPDSVQYIMAKPRMKTYIEVSAKIYSIYLQYISQDDIHVYSIDECFIDATPYLKLYRKTSKQLAHTLIDAVYKETGICATAGIGTNMFLAKIALDITAKHATDNIGYLDETTFKNQIWHHRPITDIWSIGPGIARRLAKYGVYDLAGVCELQEDTLYSEFGTNAQYLIDHAHGIESCTIKDIKEYIPKTNSLSSGQVLSCNYTFEQAKIIMQEMVEALTLELVAKDLVAQNISLSIGYANCNKKIEWAKNTINNKIPKPNTQQYFSSATKKLPVKTNSRKKILEAFNNLYEEITNKTQPIRRINIGFGNILQQNFEEYDLFSNIDSQEQEKHLQKAIIDIKSKFGKNAVLSAISLTEKSTARQRSEQVGGHHG